MTVLENLTKIQIRNLQNGKSILLKLSKINENDISNQLLRSKYHCAKLKGQQSIRVDSSMIAGVNSVSLPKRQPRKKSTKTSTKRKRDDDDSDDEMMSKRSRNDDPRISVKRARDDDSDEEDNYNESTRRRVRVRASAPEPMSTKRKRDDDDDGGRGLKKIARKGRQAFSTGKKLVRKADQFADLIGEDRVSDLLVNEAVGRVVNPVLGDTAGRKVSKLINREKDKYLEGSGLKLKKIVKGYKKADKVSKALTGKSLQHHGRRAYEKAEGGMMMPATVGYDTLPQTHHSLQHPSFKRGKGGSFRPHGGSYLLA